MNQKSSRRHFLKGAVGGLGGVIVAHVAGFFPEIEPLLAQSSREVVPVAHSSGQEDSVGESFAGFFLLPEGAPIPSFIQESKRGIPVVCGIGADKGGAVATAITEAFSNVEDLKNVIDFPIYVLQPISENFQFLEASVLKHETGEVFSVSVSFQTYNSETDQWQSTISVWAEPDFPRPFPLYFNEPIEADVPAIVLEKVDFLPSPGIMVATATGHVCHWIENGILYFLIAENSPSRSNILEIADNIIAL